MPCCGAHKPWIATESARSTDRQVVSVSVIRITCTYTEGVWRMHENQRAEYRRNSRAHSLRANCRVAAGNSLSRLYVLNG